METTHECPQRDTSNDIVIKPQVTRRHFLRLTAVGLAALGFTSQSQLAMAASTKVKAGRVTDVKLRGARVYTLNGQAIIITQPTKANFKAFSATCTHQSARINSMSGTNLICTRHNGSFDTTTGAPTGGPVRQGLRQYPVTVTNGFLYVTL
ncbi:MAG: hypothetical protein RIS43_401 [Actinomycetota bacterium]